MREHGNAQPMEIAAPSMDWARPEVLATQAVRARGEFSNRRPRSRWNRPRSEASSVLANKALAARCRLSDNEFDRALLAARIRRSDANAAQRFAPILARLCKAPLNYQPTRSTR